MSGASPSSAATHRRWPIIALIALAAALIVAALAGLALISKKSDEYAAPGLHTEVWQAYQLHNQLQRLESTARAVDAGEADAARLILTLGVMRNTLDPFRHTRVFDYLPAPRPEIAATIERLDQRSERWMAALDWQNEGAARVVAQEMLRTLPDERRPAHDVIVVSNIAVAAKLDRERQSLQRTFHWLTGMLVLLATGCLILALKILSSQRRSRRLADALQALNGSLERRVQRRTQLLHERETLLRTILESTPSEAALISADQRRVFYASDKLLACANATRVDDFRLEALFVVPDDYRQLVSRLDAGEALHQIEARLAPAAPYWALISARPLQVNAQSAWLIWSLDITRRKNMEQKLQTLASTDALTGLCNRRALLRSTVRQMRAKRQGSLSLLLIDIDHFKRVNDDWGHPVGDQVLRAMAERLRDTLRDDTLAGRIGGEEFAVVLPETTQAGAVNVAERLRVAMAEEPIVEIEGQALWITLSIGVTEHVAGESLRRLTTRADRALYRAKREGRNRCCVDTTSTPRSRPPHREAHAESDDIASP